MAYYYLVDNANIISKKGWEIHEAHAEESKEIFNKIEAKCKENGWSNSYLYHENEDQQKPLDNVKKAEMDEFLAGFHSIEGTKKAEVCAEACRVCEKLGLTETEIVRTEFSGHYTGIAQKWFVYKEDGVWYQKMDRKCKAKHEVLL